MNDTVTTWIEWCVWTVTGYIWKLRPFLLVFALAKLDILPCHASPEKYVPMHEKGLRKVGFYANYLHAKTVSEQADTIITSMYRT